MLAMSKMDEELSKIIFKNRIKAAVILRFGPNSPHSFMPELSCSEKDYYQKKYGETVDLYENQSPSNRNIYTLMNSSKMIVSSFVSTAPLEAFGNGKKILYCNFHSDNKYHNDISDQIKFSLEKEGLSALSHRLIQTLEMSEERYIKMHKRLMGYYMKYPETSNVSEFIYKKIREIVSNSSR
jgi:hypothetical protein